MTPLRARLILFAMLTIFLAAAGNALFLQERPRMLRGEAAGRLNLDNPADGRAPAVQSQEAPLDGKEPRIPLLQRELARLGYTVQLQVRGNGLRLAVLAFEFDNGMPLTGEPSKALLMQILSNPIAAPRGMFADRAEANQRLVMEVQKRLSGLGFSRGGTLSGRMDMFAEGAIRDFQRHRALPVTGRLDEVTLLELITYSGQTLQASSG